MQLYNGSISLPPLYDSSSLYECQWREIKREKERRGQLPIPSFLRIICAILSLGYCPLYSIVLAETDDRKHIYHYKQYLPFDLYLVYIHLI